MESPPWSNNDAMPPRPIIVGCGKIKSSDAGRIAKTHDRRSLLIEVVNDTQKKDDNKNMDDLTITPTVTDDELGAFASEDHGTASEDGDDDGPLSWRWDPEKSFSDWTVMVNGTDTYHVHKCYLGAGPRSSRYFAHLFAGTKSTTSLLELQDSAAQAFPDMLDFMYAPSGPVNAVTGTAVALRYLATYLGIPSLWRSVNKDFIQHDMKITTAPVYLQEASNYEDEALVQLSTRVCVEQFHSLQNAPYALATLPPNLLLHVIAKKFEKGESADDVDSSLSNALSACVAKYCQYTEHELDATFLQKVTDHNFMPDISPEAVTTLLRAAVKTGFINEDHMLVDEFVVKARGIDTPAISKGLLKRCRDSIKIHWNRALLPCILTTNKEDQDENLINDYKALPDKIKVALLEEALRHAVVVDRKPRVDASCSLSSDSVECSIVAVGDY